MLRAYRMMLDFYGIEPRNDITGRLQRGTNWRERMAHLNRFTSQLFLLSLLSVGWHMVSHCILRNVQQLKKSCFLCFKTFRSMYYFWDHSVTLAFIQQFCVLLLHSVVWHCWFGGRKGIRLVKTEWWGTVMVIYQERDVNDCIWSSWYHCHPIISCFSKIQNGSAFLLLAYPGCPGKKAVKWI